MVARRAKADQFAARLAPVLHEMSQRNISLRQMAEELTRRGVLTAQGGVWTATAVRRVLARG